jgi:hypothetical protein
MVENERERERMERVLERLTKSESLLAGHENVCAERYERILEKIVSVEKSITDTRDTMASNGRLYLTIAFLLFTLELGKLTVPVMFEFLMKMPALAAGLH